MREKPERAFGGQKNMESIDPTIKALQLMVQAMEDYESSNLPKEEVKARLISTIDENIQYWSEVKKALKEIS